MEPSKNEFGLPVSPGADVTTLSVDHNWANLTEVLLGALRDPQRAQRMANAAAQEFRVRSDPELIAADLSKVLLEAVRREFPGGGGLATAAATGARRPGDAGGEGALSGSSQLAGGTVSRGGKEAPAHRRPGAAGAAAAQQ